MSTFQGLVPEIPDISIDRFDGQNVYSKVFFLSHCHMDHMYGIGSPQFTNSLIRRPDVYLYGSPVTIKILTCRHPVLKAKLKKLPVNIPSLIEFPCDDKRLLTVTLLSAGHCPGSVMFLFETSDKNILYTGDYRVSASDLRKYPAFYHPGKVPKKIHKMYLDTTFFSPSYMRFPTRLETSEVMCKIIEEWISESKQNVVLIKTSATYGSENLFMDVAKKFGMPIHVNNTAYDFYSYIPEMDQAVTRNPNITQIHSSCGDEYWKICETGSRCHLRIIKPSAMRWKDRNLENGIVDHNEKLFNVCCSSHSSFEEIKEFLMFLRPEEVEPNVMPRTAYETKVMFDAIRAIMDSYNEKEPKEIAEEVKLFNIPKKRSEPEQSKETDSFLDDLLASPPRKTKKQDI